MLCVDWLDLIAFLDWLFFGISVVKQHDAYFGPLMIDSIAAVLQ